MSSHKNNHLQAPEIAESGGVCTIEEICIACQVEQGWVAGLVAHGVIEPVADGSQDGVRFSASSVMRVAKAKRLERDLSLNTPGVALALDLLDEIERLRARLGAAPFTPSAWDE
ncbi:MAG TPA: chaperone modulator CbpM [Hyphomicrobium sp.]|nr:chaperone modulator CbpM [Hyphomicrobium sp.]